MIPRSLFRGKTKSEEWAFGSLLESGDNCYLLNSEQFRLTGDEISFTGKAPVRIDPASACRYTGIVTKKGEKVFEKDIVELELLSGTKYRYLIWYKEEGNETAAVPWNHGDDAEFLYGCPVNYFDKIEWSEFFLMMQDPYGDIKDIRIVGNVVDNPELKIV